jgi:hypothetical protein
MVHINFHRLVIRCDNFWRENKLLTPIIEVPSFRTLPFYSADKWTNSFEVESFHLLTHDVIPWRLIVNTKTTHTHNTHYTLHTHTHTRQNQFFAFLLLLLGSSETESLLPSSAESSTPPFDNNFTEWSGSAISISLPSSSFIFSQTKVSFYFSCVSGAVYTAETQYVNGALGTRTVNKPGCTSGNP